MKDNRHLAAIFFSDMVGYTAASNRDQDLALRLLEEHRAILRPLIAKYEGREIKTMGDGFLVEFGNARSATFCAIEAQQAHHARNLNSGPNSQVQIRIGIHISDVVENDNDVYGDGVNIAARLMQVARPGRICISSPVMDQVRTSVDRWITKIGPQKLKGISRNITAFIIYPEFSKDQPPPFLPRMRVRYSKHRRKVIAAGVATVLLGAGMYWAPLISGILGPKASPRIAVLPLKGLGLKESESFLAEGLTDEIISSLSRVKAIRVLSKNSSSRLDSGNSSGQAGGLNLSGIVEGSVQKIGDKLRIHVGLTDVKSQENLWSKDFEGDFADTFETQKTVAQEIAQQFMRREKVKGGDENLKQLTTHSGRPRPNDKAYLHYLKAKQLMQKRNEMSLKSALSELELAAGIDPNFSYAHAVAANIYTLLNFYGYTRPDEAIQKGHQLAAKALELEPENPEALLWFAENYAYIRHEWGKAFEFYERAIKSNSNLAKSYQWYAEALVCVGRFAEARANYQKARELDPLAPVVIVASGAPDFFSGKYDAALAIYARATEVDPESMLPYLWAGKAWLQKKNYAKALESFQKAETYSERSSLVEAFKINALYLLGNKAEAQMKLKGLLDRPVMEHVSHYSLAHVFLTMGHEDRALAELERAVEAKESTVPFLKVDPIFAPLRENPRFKVLLRQLALAL